MRKKIFAGLLASLAMSAAVAVAGPVTWLDRIVAVVNDEVITQTDLDEQMNTVRRQLRQQRTAMPAEAQLRDQVLERMVLTQLQLQLAAKYGIKVDDETLDRALENIAGQNKLDLAQFRTVLEGEGYVYNRFREDIRREITLTRLRQREVDNRIIITDPEVDNFLTTQATQGNPNDEYHLSHILIAVPEAATPERINEVRADAEQVLKSLRNGADFAQTAIARSAGQQALDGGDLGWRKLGQLPSLFADTVGHMKEGETSELIRSPGGFHIIKLTGKRAQKDERSVIKQTRARHILIRTSDTVSASEARQRLERLKERIEKGENFADLARAHSEDPGSGADGGNLGWVNPGVMVPEFEEAMNNTAVGKVSEPFQSRFGWHIVQAQERRDYDNTEDLRRTKAREQLRQRRAEEETQQWLRRLRDEAYVDLRGGDGG